MNGFNSHTHGSSASAYKFLAFGLVVMILSSPAFALHDTELTGTTQVHGAIQMDDTVGQPGGSVASTAGQWNVTLWNGLFVHGASSTSAIDFSLTAGEPVMFWYPPLAAFRAGLPGSGGTFDQSKLGYGSAAFGHDTEASGVFSMAWGWGAKALGFESTAWGESISSGTYSTTWGVASATSTFSTAWGFANASGLSSTAWGGYAYAQGDYSTAWGDSTAGGNYATASGYMCTADALASTTIGSGNIGIVDLINSGKTQWVELDALFEIGNNYNFMAAPSNAVTVLKNGLTTLTNKAWKDELSDDPLGTPSDPTNSSEGTALVVEGHSEFQGKVMLTEAQGDISMGAFGISN